MDGDMVEGAGGLFGIVLYNMLFTVVYCVDLLGGIRDARAVYLGGPALR